MDCGVFFGGADQIRLVVVINKHGHIARHLASVEIDKELVPVVFARFRVRPEIRRAPVRQLFFHFRARLLQNSLFADGILFRIRTERADILIRPRDFVGNRNAATRGFVVVAFLGNHVEVGRRGSLALAEFEVHPHDILARLLVEYDLRTLQDSTDNYVAARLFVHFKGNAFVLPVVEVGGAVTVDAHNSLVAEIAANLVLAEQVVAAVVVDNPRAVRVNVPAVVVEQHLPGRERLRGRNNRRRVYAGVRRARAKEQHRRKKSD